MAVTKYSEKFDINSYKPKLSDLVYVEAMFISPVEYRSSCKFPLEDVCSGENPKSEHRIPRILMV
jgi:hypothetical protein